MAKKKPSEPFKLGDRVRIRLSGWRGRIVEERGPLAPGGVLVFRIRIPEKPRPRYIEVREDQLTLIPTPPKAEPAESVTGANSEPQSPKNKTKRNTGTQRD